MIDRLAANARVVAALLKELGKNLALQNVERFRVAEEAGDRDEHVGEQRVELFDVAEQERRVVNEPVVLAEHHPPGDAPLNSG